MNRILPYEGTRVLDASGSLGAYASRLLAAMGADVVLLEPPSGSELRRRPPYAEDGQSLVFAYYAQGCRSVTLDVSKEEAIEPLTSLAAMTDVVLVAPTPDLPVAGLRVGEGTPTIDWTHSQNVVVCLTPFGLTGPWAGFRSTPLVSYAVSGQMWKLGSPDEPPPAPPAQVVYDQLALNALAAVLLALRDRPRVGGQWIDLSLHEVLASTEGQVTRYGRTGKFLQRRRARLGSAPSGVWKTADGAVEVMVHNPNHWRGFVRAVGSPEVLCDPSLEDREVRYHREEWLAADIADRLSKVAVGEFIKRCEEERVPAAPYRWPDELVGDEHLAARGFWSEGSTGTSRVRLPGMPFQTEPSLFSERSQPSPALGQHTRELLLGECATAGNKSGGGHAAESSGTRPDRPGPLSDMRVLSFGQAIAGNVSSMALSELGADVVKIESDSRPDPNRVRMNSDDPDPRVFEPGGHETNPLFANFTRSLQSISLDMTLPSDRALFGELLAEADVLLENFGPRVMDKWGLSRQALFERNPKLVYISISGYGRSGPKARAVAYGSNVHAYVGLTRVWTEHGTFLDYLAAATAVPAVLAGLEARDRSGQGVFIDLTQSESGVAAMPALYLGALNGMPDPPDRPASCAGSLLAGVFACAGEQRWVAVEVRNRSEWEGACRVLGREDLAGVASGEAGGGAIHELEREIAEWCSTLTPHQAALRLQHAGVPAGAVRDGEELYLDPQHAARGAFQEVRHPDLGPLIEVRPPIRASRSDIAVRGPSPRVGQHTDAVIQRWLQRPTGPEPAGPTGPEPAGSATAPSDGSAVASSAATRGEQ